MGNWISVLHHLATSIICSRSIGLSNWTSALISGLRLLRKLHLRISSDTSVKNRWRYSLMVGLCRRHRNGAQRDPSCDDRNHRSNWTFTSSQFFIGQRHSSRLNQVNASPSKHMVVTSTFSSSVSWVNPESIEATGDFSVASPSLFVPFLDYPEITSTNQAFSSSLPASIWIPILVILAQHGVLGARSPFFV